MSALNAFVTFHIPILRSVERLLPLLFKPGPVEFPDVDPMVLPGEHGVEPELPCYGP